MSREKRKGLFISFEGGEGAGKTTQIKRVVDWLNEQGIVTVQTREPGGTPGAEEIRALVLKGESNRWTPKTEAMLMYAARQEHVEKVIKPALERGEVVVCDRFSDSSMAYQGVGHGLGLEKLAELDHWVLGDFKPDITLLLDIPVKVGLERTTRRSGDEVRFEGMAIEFHERLREGFLSIAASDPERCKVIDAQQSADTVTKEILELLEPVFLSRKDDLASGTV
ncbi:dTMP kinase [Kiloniella sp. b19]|uniref:dTMP kinase n=1 Tax=Kiloniella sp. GXU_MW_B19 TaxID=3141326 RepID=UPI0031D03383